VLDLSEVHVVSVPMRVPFRGVLHREALLLRGPAGWGEFAPFLEYDDVESARWLAAALEATQVGWPAAVRDEVPVNATVPAVPAAAVEAVLARFPGCTTAKVKVAQAGQVLRDDVDRVAAVRDVLGPTGRVRVDANGAWTLSDARWAVAALSAFDLEYVEQPCESVEDLALLRVALARAGIEVLVAADESVRKAEDPLRVARAGAADVLVLKVAPLGGVRPGPADRRGVRPAGRGVQRAGHLRRHQRGGGARCRAAGAAVRLRARHDQPHGGGRGARLARRARRRDPAGRVEPDPELLARHAAPSSAGTGGWPGWRAARRCWRQTPLL
jgi:hypothetical protein